MSESEPKRIFVGHLPAGGVTYVADGEIDPVARLIADAEGRLAAERAEAERVRLAAIADVERAKATRRVRALRRLTKAFKGFARLR